ncbi:MAG: hypothetical protein WA081_14375 [Desulfosalsimonadaceae bacterium]
MGIGANKKQAWFVSGGRRNYSGLPITHPEAFVSPISGLRTDMAKLGENIVLIKSFGYINSQAESELIAFIDDFIARHCDAQHGIVYVEDYSSIHGADSDDLGPPVLYDFGMKEALQTLSATIAAKHNIRIRPYFAGETDTIKDEIKAILYRNLKELMHNTVLCRSTLFLILKSGITACFF